MLRQPLKHIHFYTISLNTLAGNASFFSSILTGPFDEDGFPIALSNSLEQLKVAVTAARKRNVNSSDDLEVQSALTALLNQTSLSPRIRQLLQERKLVYHKLVKMINSEEADQLNQKMRAISEELSNDRCLARLEQSLESSLGQDLLF